MDCIKMNENKEDVLMKKSKVGPMLEGKSKEHRDGQIESPYVWS